jgi:hypothetical protein
MHMSLFVAGILPPINMADFEVVVERWRGYISFSSPTLEENQPYPKRPKEHIDETVKGRIYWSVLKLSFS